jgi:hypothetical protein
VPGRKVVGLISGLCRFAYDADNRIAGDHERGTKETLFGKFLVRGHFAVILPDEFELVGKVFRATFRESGHGDQIVEFSIFKDCGDKLIQFAWPLTAKAKLTSQDCYALVTLHPVCKCALGHAEWHA